MALPVSRLLNSAIKLGGPLVRGLYFPGPLGRRLSKLFPFSRCRSEKGERVQEEGSNPQKFSYPLALVRGMENTSLHEREAALLRSIDRVLNSRLSWDAIERWVARFSRELDEVRRALAAEQPQAGCGQAPPRRAEGGMQ